MTEERTKKKGISWFKGISSNQGKFEQEHAEQQLATTEIEEEQQSINKKESKQTDTQSNNNLFSKENQDKVTLDLIVSLENMLKDRQLILYKNKGLDEQLLAANKTISRLKQEQMKSENLLLEKSKEIETLETSLTNKQMSYEQLLEDYKEYQNTVHIQFEKMSNQLETEINKYNKLNEESANAQYQSMLKINDLEEKVRSLEIENQKYAEQYQKTLDEKSELMRTINDFTEKMSFSFSSKGAASNPSDYK